MNFIRYILYGILMGIANVIPGVSGGTIAIILNFYDKLMESITLNVKVIIKNLNFLIPLAIGLAIGILGLSNVMKFLLEKYTTQTYFGFIGIVLGSLPLIYYKAGSKDIKPVSLIPFIATTVLMIFLALFKGAPQSSEPLFTALTFKSFIVLFVAMVIASVTMIIPGISGSLILIIMGLYGTIFGYAVATLNIPLLIPIGLGAIVGILGGAKIISYLLARYSQFTYMAIMGLLAGSLVQLYINSNVVIGFNFTFISSTIILILFFALIYWFSFQEINRSKEEGR